MAVGNFLGNCLRYSRADYLRKLVRLQSNMQFIHRSVGEPAEGSLTRYPYVNQWESFSHSLHGEWAGFVEVLEGIASAISLYLLFLHTEMFAKTLYLLWRLISPELPFHWELVGNYINLFHLLLVDFYMLDTVHCILFTRLLFER